MIAARAHHGALTGAIRETESMKKYPPTAKQFSAYFKKHDLTLRSVCEMVGASKRTVGYWKSGEVEMPYAVWFTLRTKVEGKAPSQ